MEILEDEAQRPLASERADELEEPVERLALDGIAREAAEALLLLRLERQAEKRGEERVGLLRLIAEAPGELGAELDADSRLRVGQADTEPASELLAHGPVRDRLRVRDRVAREKADPTVEVLGHLGHQARLADPGLAGDGYDRPLAEEKSVEHVAQLAELSRTADERRFGIGPAVSALAGHAECGNGLDLALELEIAQFLELEHVFDLACRRSAPQRGRRAPAAAQPR